MLVASHSSPPYRHDAHGIWVIPMGVVVDHHEAVGVYAPIGVTRVDDSRGVTVTHGLFDRFSRKTPLSQTVECVCSPNYAAYRHRRLRLRTARDAIDLRGVGRGPGRLRLGQPARRLMSLLKPLMTRKSSRTIPIELKRHIAATETRRPRSFSTTDQST